MDIYIVLTGRKGHGKDTVAEIAVNKGWAQQSLALADWFKNVLSKEFNVPLAHFYDRDQKEENFLKPIVVKMSNLRSLKKAWSDLAGMGFKVDKLSVSKWLGREIHNVRELMLWFGNEVVANYAGQDFHCKVLDETLAKLPRANDINVFIITDARNFEQSNYFVKKYGHVYPVKIVNPEGSQDIHTTETSVDEFPSNYFFQTIVNDGTIEDLETKVLELFSNINVDLKARKKNHT